jgi:hypothetical protein
MIKLSELFPGKTDGSDPVGYPHGAFKNSTVEGAYDGTPITRDVMNDVLGFHEALMLNTSTSADGGIEKANDSQLLEALRKYIRWQALVQVTGDAAGYGTVEFDRPSGIGAASNLLLLSGGVTTQATAITSYFRMRHVCIPGVFYHAIRTIARPVNIADTVVSGPYITKFNTKTGAASALVTGGSKNITYTNASATPKITVTNLDSAFTAVEGDVIEFGDPFGGAGSYDMYLLSASLLVHPDPPQAS